MLVRARVVSGINFTDFFFKISDGREYKSPIGETTASESVLEREQEGNHHWIGNNPQEFLREMKVRFLY